MPEPSDLVLDEGDRIVAVFNENVNCFKISESQLTVKNLSTGQTVDASVGCNVNSIMVIPDLSGMTFENDNFNVEISGIEDLYGNAMTDPVSWTFVIKADPTPSGTEDTDMAWKTVRMILSR
jgi:hypothetical protein